MFLTIKIQITSKYASEEMAHEFRMKKCSEHKMSQQWHTEGKQSGPTTVRHNGVVHVYSHVVGHSYK